MRQHYQISSGLPTLLRMWSIPFEITVLGVNRLSLGHLQKLVPWMKKTHFFWTRVTNTHYVHRNSTLWQKIYLS